MLRKSTVLLIASTALVLLSANASAADGAAIYASKGCAACHGADGKTPLMPTYPKVAGQTKEYTVQQLNDIKSGARSNGLSIAMKAIMASVSDDEINALGEYLSNAN